MEYQTKGFIGLIIVFIGLSLSYFGVYLELLTILLMEMGAFMILTNIKLMLEEREVSGNSSHK